MLRRGVLLAIVGFVVLGSLSPVMAAERPGAGGRGNVATLSPYWSPRVQRWSPYITEVAVARQLDPDFLASLVWMESRGDPQAIGPVGAVGLMQVMPREAGFSWRPSRQALMDPETNLQAGCRTLVDIIHQGRGDLFNTLAAYNGGWEQIMYRGPKYFATTIMRDYATALAVRYGLEAGAEWQVVFAPRLGGGVVGPVWVVDARRPDVFYFGDSLRLPDGSQLVPKSVPPTSVVARYRLDDHPAEIVAWLYDGRTERWVAP